MKATLEKLFSKEELTQEEARDTLTKISKGEFPEAQVIAFMTVFLMRDITADELSGFRQALIDLCKKINLEGRDAIDIVGTGGDGKNTFNISTLSSFVVAGAGYNVAKHGNKGVSSACGSSNVLHHLGYNFTADEDLLKRQLDKSNICFFHAPLFHPALKGVAPLRKGLGMKTFFNMLGPLVNPAEPRCNLLGVYNEELTDLYYGVLKNSKKTFTILHAMDGYDEVSLTGEVKLVNESEAMVVAPDYFNLPTISPSDIYGGETVEEAAKIFIDILDGRGSEAQRSVIYANAGLAIHCFDRNKSLSDAIAEARESLDSGKARMALNNLIKTQ